MKSKVDDVDDVDDDAVMIRLRMRLNAIKIINKANNNCWAIWEKCSFISNNLSNQ